MEDGCPAERGQPTLRLAKRSRHVFLGGLRRSFARLLLVTFAALLPSLVAAGPTLTIIAPAAPGGGWDQTARVMQRVLLEIEPGASVQVDNVPGAAGTIGLARFIQSERGNPDALLVTGLVMVSGVVINHSPVTLANILPIARLTGEFEVVVVPASSPYRSLGDLLAAFRAAPRAVSWGGGSAGGTDDLLIRLITEQLGLAPSAVNWVAFSGGGAALGAVLGGQVTAGVSGYAEFAGQIEAGQLRILAVSAPERIAGINAPTLREAGVALDLANWRAVVAPPGLSDAERASLTDRVAAWRAANCGKRHWRRTAGATSSCPARTSASSCLRNNRVSPPCCNGWRATTRLRPRGFRWR